MLGVGSVAAGVTLVFVVGLVCLVGSVLVRTVVGPDASTAGVSASREWRQVLGVRALGILAGVVLGSVTWGLGTSGRGPMLALAVFGLCVLLGTAVGETVVRPARPAGVRTASLAARRVRDHLPWTAWLVGLLVVLAASVLTLTTLTATDDSLGRARALGCSTATTSSVRSPYPGAFYSVPLAVVLVLVLVTASVAARRVALRPRGMAADDAGDDRLRRDSLQVVVAATGVAVGAPLSGVAVIGGGALSMLASDPGGCAPGWYAGAGTALLLVGVFAMLTSAPLLGRLFRSNAAARG